MPNPLYFHTLCNQCGWTALVKVHKLGQRIECPKCAASFTATDAELESLAMDEDMGRLAKVLDWPEDRTNHNADVHRPR